jgi:hypothetical protein
MDCVQSREAGAVFVEITLGHRLLVPRSELKMRFFFAYDMVSCRTDCLVAQPHDYTHGSSSRVEHKSSFP